MSRGIVTTETEDYETTATILKKSETNRGFGLIEFNDRYEQRCSLQDSSLATEAAIWFGVDNTGPHLTGPRGSKGEDVKQRMHLTQEMVKQLLPYLTRFAKTGEYLRDME